MKVPFHRLRLPVVAVLAMAWMVASNHCAIASLTGGHPQEHSCCKKEKPSSNQPCAEKCCNGLAAPVPVADTVHSPVCPLIATLPDPVEALAHGYVRSFDSGLAPPGRVVSYFVEFIAGSSHQPMAPPAFVD